MGTAEKKEIEKLLPIDPESKVMLWLHEHAEKFPIVPNLDTNDSKKEQPEEQPKVLILKDGSPVSSGNELKFNSQYTALINIQDSDPRAYSIIAKNFITKIVKEISTKANTGEVLSLLGIAKRKRLYNLLHESIETQLSEDIEYTKHQEVKRQLAGAYKSFQETTRIQDKLKPIDEIKTIAKQYNIALPVPPILNENNLPPLVNDINKKIDESLVAIRTKIEAPVKEALELPEFVVNAMADETPILPNQELFAQFMMILFPHQRLAQDYNDQYQFFMNEMIPQIRSVPYIEEPIEIPTPPSTQQQTTLNSKARAWRLAVATAIYEGNQTKSGKTGSNIQSADGQVCFPTNPREFHEGLVVLALRKLKHMSQEALLQGCYNLKSINSSLIADIELGRSTLDNLEKVMRLQKGLKLNDQEKQLLFDAIEIRREIAEINNVSLQLKKPKDKQRNWDDDTAHIYQNKIKLLQEKLDEYIGGPEVDNLDQKLTKQENDPALEFHLGIFITRLRELKGITREEFSKQCHAKVKNIIELENNGSISTNVLPKIKSFLFNDFDLIRLYDDAKALDGFIKRVNKNTEENKIDDLCWDAELKHIVQEHVNHLFDRLNKKYSIKAVPTTESVTNPIVAGSENTKLAQNRA